METAKYRGLRHVEELMEERGVKVDHATTNR
jgi:transposase-like protein